MRDVSTRLFHVTSVLNRESIEAHGLDWTFMGAACGIAGSSSPELRGIFVTASRFDADFFVQMNNTGGPVDVWAIDGVDPAALVTSGSGFTYLPDRVSREQVTLLERSLPVRTVVARTGPSTAYGSTLAISFDDDPARDGGAAARVEPLRE